MSTYQDTIFNLDRQALELAIRPIFTGKEGGIVRKKVEHVRSLTHFTEADTGGYHPGTTFSVEGAIQAQVEFEDLMRWSEQPEEFRPVAGLPEAPVAITAGFRNLIRSFIP